MNDLCRLSASEMLVLLRKRELSCRELLEAHVAQIERLNPKINAIVTTTFESALQTAIELDSKSKLDKALFGLPVAHKDLLSTKNIRTTYGFPPLANFLPKHDAWIVSRMRNAGAVMVGKTNVPEFGAGSHTFNRVFGATRNPYDLTRTVGGSSGGAAAALASRIIPIADGSDTGGSLRNPAAFCNVVGFRPSAGRVPQGPHADPWTDLSQLGPMARTVDDVALLFSVLAGPDSRAPRALDTPGSEFKELPPVSLKGLKVAFSEDFGLLPVEKPVREAISSFAAILEREGAHVCVDTPNLADGRRIFHILRGIGFRKRFFNFSANEFKELKQTIRWNIDAGNALQLEDLEWAMAARSNLVNQIIEFFLNYDVWIGPATQVMPFPVEVDWVREIEGRQMSNYIEWMESCSLISITGLPTLSLPAGFHSGLPVGIQVIAPIRQDHFLLRVSKAMESVTNFQAEQPQLLELNN